MHETKQAKIGTAHIFEQKVITERPRAITSTRKFCVHSLYQLLNQIISPFFIFLPYFDLGICNLCRQLSRAVQ